MEWNPTSDFLGQRFPCPKPFVTRPNKWCSRLDLHQHCTGFESVASAGWATGAKVVPREGFAPPTSGV